MRTLKFYGHSDDCFEIDGTTRDEPDEIGCFDGSVTVTLIDANGDGLQVVGSYAKPHNTGTWMFGISLLDEDKPLPSWPIRFSTFENNYSPLVEIDVPDDVVVKEVSK